MAYYMVVHHMRDENQPWTNTWDGDLRLAAITTTPEIAARCALAISRGERIFVHRCRWRESAAEIACSVEVQDIGHDAQLGWVRFKDAVVLRSQATVQPARGQNCYDADPPVTRQL